MGGARRDLLGRRLLDELAGVHDEDRVGDLVEHGEIVRDHDRAPDELAVAKLDEELGDGLLGRDVERRGELVCDQEAGVEEGRENHHDPLFHPARELDREALEDVLVEADEREAAGQLRKAVVVALAAGGEQLTDQLADLPRRVERAHRVLGDERDLAEPVAVHRPVVGDRQLRAVEHDTALDVAHAPVEPDEALPERRLAAAGLAGEPHDLAVRDREGDAVERLHVAP